MTTTTPRPRPLDSLRADPLRTVLRLDAVVTGVNGLAYLAAAPVLPDLLGISPGVLRGVGAFLLAYAAGVWLVAARPAVSPGATEVVIGANLLWTAGSVAAVVTGRFDLTATGTVWVLLQAAVVGGFAALQIAALRNR